MQNFNLVQLTDNILELCHKNSISINKMEKDSGIRKSVIDNMKRGSVPTIDKIAAIAQYFDVTIDYLIYNKNAKS